MAKQKTHPVRKVEKDPNHIGTISAREIEKRVRKALPPPSRVHRSKTNYSRKHKHPKKDADG